MQAIPKHLQREASHEQKERHEGEGDEQKVSTTERVDGIHCRERHQEIQQTKAPRREQSLDLGETGLREYSG